jgi:FtsZ-interacting cell division protein YlmF
LFESVLFDFPQVENALMGNFHSARAIADFNQLAFKNLLRAIASSERQFSLILVSCPPSDIHQQIIKKLQAQCDLPIREIILHPATTDLFSVIQSFIQTQYIDRYLGALLISGLDSLIAPEDLLRTTNLIREEFRKNFPFPLVLWVNDEITSLLRRCAPELRHWATTPIHFEMIDSQEIPIESENYLPKNISLPYIRQSYTETKFGSVSQNYSTTNNSKVRSEKRNNMIAMLNTDHGVPEVVIMEPSSFTEVPSYIDILRARKSVILNLARISADEAQRAVDFLAGVTYALDGNQKRVGNSVFLFTPSSVILSTSLSEKRSMTA